MTDRPDPPEWVKTKMNVPLFVGMIANSWAKMEHALIPLANKLLRTADNNVGKIIILSLNAPAKRDLLLALAEIAPLSSTQKNEIAEFCKEFERLRKLRNDIVHGRWDGLSEAGTPILHTSSARSSLKESFTEKEVTWLIQTQSEIDGLIARAMEINDTLTGLWPSTGTPRRPRQSH